MPLESYENSHVRTYWDEQQRCVVLDWDRSPAHEALQAGLRSALALMRRHGSTRLLADSTPLQLVGGASRGAVAARPLEMADYLGAVGQ